MWRALCASALNPSSLIALKDTLNETELRHACAFRFDMDRTRYIFSHGVLRDVLVRYLTMSPEEILFDANEYGKPFLRSERSNRILFNLSHSGDLAVIAVCLDNLVGVDCELIRPTTDFDLIAERSFTERERIMMNAKGEAEKAWRFYTCWTRKEAYIKAVGKGLSIPLTSFETSIPRMSAGHVIEGIHHSPCIEKWWLSDITLPSGYVGALVTEGEQPTITYRDWVHRVRK